MSRTPLVLLVEDSQTQAQEIKFNLERHGFHVMVAGDGITGLRIVDQHRPDLIVLDINLPDMDGYQICRRLKRDPQIASIPVIMLTVEDNSAATLAGLEAGADDYIPKDVFAHDNLLSTLNALAININPTEYES